MTHLWELGGGTSLSELADTPINAHSIRLAMVFFLAGLISLSLPHVCSFLSLVLVLDLSRPDQLWNTLQVFLQKVSTLG